MQVQIPNMGEHPAELKSQQSTTSSSLLCLFEIKEVRPALRGIKER